MRIRSGGVPDVPVLMAMFDEAVAWMVAQGNTEQWGTEPWSGQPQRVERITAMVSAGELWIAEVDGAEVDGAEVDGAEVDGAEVDGAEVDGAEVDGAEVDGAEVDGAEVDGAEVGGVAAGVLITSDQPTSYVEPAGEPELYVSLLLTSRRYAGLKVGATLLDHARSLALAKPVSLMRVDCYAGGDGSLVRYYERNGFVRTQPFKVGEWPGQVLEQRLPAVRLPDAR